MIADFAERSCERGWTAVYSMTAAADVAIADEADLTCVRYWTGD